MEFTKRSEGSLLTDFEKLDRVGEIVVMICRIWSGSFFGSCWKRRFCRCCPQWPSSLMIFLRFDGDFVEGGVVAQLATFIDPTRARRTVLAV